MALRRRVFALAPYSLILCAPLAYSLGLHFAEGEHEASFVVEPATQLAEVPGEPVQEVVLVPVFMPTPAQPSEPAVEAARPTEATSVPLAESEIDSPVPEPGAFIFVRDGELVLAEGVDGQAWGRGAIRGTVRDEVVARRQVDMKSLPEAFGALLETSIDLYGAEGRVCSVEIDGFELIARYSGEAHYIDEDQPTTSAERRAILEEVFGGEDTWLTADYTATGDCEGALWGRAASFPEPRLLAPIDAEGVAAAGKGLFLASSWYRGAEEVYQDYLAGLDDEERAETTDWRAFTEEHLQIAVWGDPEDETPELMSLSFGDPDSSCGEGFWENMSVSYVLDEVAALNEHAHAPLPDAVFDLEGDGNLEFVYTYDEGVSFVDGSGVTREAAVFWDGCPC
jgi:hypothetical protein